MRGSRTDTAAQGGTASDVAEQAKPKARRTRRTVAEADGGAVKRRRPRSAPAKNTAVFGVHSALFDRMQHQAALATVMKKHLEAMQSEFSTLDEGVQAFCETLIEKIAQSGMDALTKLNLVPKADMIKDEPKKAEPAKDGAAPGKSFNNL